MPLLPLDPLIDAAVDAAQGRDLVLLPTISRPDEDLDIRGAGAVDLGGTGQFDEPNLGESYRKGLLRWVSWFMHRL